MRLELNPLVTRCLNDSAYLGRFLVDPAGAASELGVDLTIDELAQINAHRAGVREVVAGRFAYTDCECTGQWC